MDEYKYSIVGNRVESEVEQTTTVRMYYDGADCVGEYDGASTRYYMTPMLDENMLMNNGSDYFYTQDGLGSVRELIDTNQAAQNSYDYEAFGAFYGTPTENVDNRYAYTGREWDSESQAYYYRARYYYPTIGGFNGRDPLETSEESEESNLYVYVRANPANATDPYGEATKYIWELYKGSKKPGRKPRWRKTECLMKQYSLKITSMIPPTITDLPQGRTASGTAKFKFELTEKVKSNSMKDTCCCVVQWMRGWNYYYKGKDKKIAPSTLYGKKVSLWTKGKWVVDLSLIHI